MPATIRTHQHNVGELQEYLRTIARFEKQIPAIIPDRVYGRETTEAVAAFQLRYKLPVTGSVDQDTWEKIYEEYLRIMAMVAKPMPLEVFPSPDFTLQRGSSGDLVFALQLVITSLSAMFLNIPKPDISGRFDATTEQAVKKIQEKSGIAVTGIVDLFTWNAMASAYNVFSKMIIEAASK